MTQESWDFLVETARRTSTELGYTVTASDVLRTAVDDGCAALARALDSPAPAAVSLPMELVDRIVEEVTQARGDLRRGHNNINQIAHHANATKGELPEDLAELRRLFASIDGRLRDLAITVVGAPYDELEALRARVAELEAERDQGQGET